jgi:hypothetical protein
LIGTTYIRMDFNIIIFINCGLTNLLYRESDIFGYPSYMAIGSVKGHTCLFSSHSTLRRHWLSSSLFYRSRYSIRSPMPFSQCCSVEEYGYRVASLTEPKRGSGEQGSSTEPSAGWQGSRRWMGIASPLTEPARGDKGVNETTSVHGALWLFWPLDL